MLEIFYSLAQDNPLLFGVILFNVFVGGYILAYFTLYLYKKRHPEIMLNILLWKTYVRKNHEVNTVDELYIAVMDRLRKERIISKQDGTGKRARDKSIAGAGPELKKVLQDIFDIYERKKYGGVPIEREADWVGSLFERLLSV